jgi:hypothetical protein
LIQRCFLILPHTHTHAQVVISLLEELLGRGGLQSAVSGRHAQTLCPILDFLAKYLTGELKCPYWRQEIAG